MLSCTTQCCTHMLNSCNIKHHYAYICDYASSQLVSCLPFHVIWRGNHLLLLLVTGISMSKAVWCPVPLLGVPHVMLHGTACDCICR